MKNPFKNMFQPPEHKIEITSTAVNGDNFRVTVKVVYGRYVDYDLTVFAHKNDLDDTKTRLIRYAAEYIENSKKNSTEVIKP